MKLEHISAQAEEVAPFKYRISTPPKPHSAFDAYVGTPEKGKSLAAQLVSAIGIR
jgi:hypothetical protein